MTNSGNQGLRCPKCNSPKLILKSQGLRECLKCQHSWVVGNQFFGVLDVLVRIRVKNLIRTTDMPIEQAIAKARSEVQIAIDGEGRIDELRLAGGHG